MQISLSSDEEPVNTSEELAIQEQINRFLLNIRDNYVNISEGQRKQVGTSHQHQCSTIEDPLPSIYWEPPPQQRGEVNLVHHHDPAELMDRCVGQLIWKAETSKARVLDIPGRQANNFDQPNFTTKNENGLILNAPNQFMCTAMMDDDYLILAMHADEGLERCVNNGEYIDFARLLPRDRGQMQQDNRIKLVQVSGHLSCVLVSDNVTGSISSFVRWEQAFRVFSNNILGDSPRVLQNSSNIIR